MNKKYTISVMKGRGQNQKVAGVSKSTRRYWAFAYNKFPKRGVVTWKYHQQVKVSYKEWKTYKQIASLQMI